MLKGAFLLVHIGRIVDSPDIASLFDLFACGGKRWGK